ncbi:MAG: RNA polymerase sigma factor, partial [Eubacterium sp.]
IAMQPDSKRNSLLCEMYWKEYEPQVRRLCNHKLSRYPQEVDEIVSDTYLNLCITLNNGVHIDKPLAWLYSVANNLIKNKYTEINKQKENQISLSVYDNGTTFDIPYYFDYLDKIIGEKGIAKSYNEIIDELNDKEIKILELVYEDHLKYKEIAEMLGSTEFAVKQNVYRLNKKIRALVKEKIKNFL